MKLGIWRDVLLVVRYLVMHFLMWLAVFAFQRLLFVTINSNYAIDLDVVTLVSSFWCGLVFDLSIAAYMGLLFCVVVVLLAFFVQVKRLLVACNIVSGILATIIMILLPMNAYLYGYWGAHFDATSLHFLKDPKLVLASVETWHIIVLGVVSVFMFLTTRALQMMCMRRLFRRQAEGMEVQRTVKGKVLTIVVALVLGGLMIIPIRGGLGIAPLNTGRAYFSQDIFANHTAINPVWNFIYSLKRLDATTVRYEFMEQSEAQRIYDDMMKDSGATFKILNTAKPNVIVILLESFSAHGIKYLGGENATPQLDNLLKESLAFNNIMAASDRSGKGLVATLCGYPTLPTMSIIQYPHKTQSLPIVSQSLRKEGYLSQAFLYGGDLRFNNFNTLVTLGGFDNIITEEDFPSDAMSDKWGAHDEFVFDRLLKLVDSQPQPFFNFFFTLSSHEPFTVPMERQLDDDYLNSMYYTDRCLGDFIDKAKNSEWWDNTLIILLADHGHAGAERVGNEDRRRFNIPLIFTGGAVAVKDTIVERYGTQTDLAKTLLRQLDIDDKEYTFSKDLLDNGVKGFSFYDFNDGFGYIDAQSYEVWDNSSSTWLKREGKETECGKAFLQIMSDDFHSR